MSTTATTANNLSRVNQTAGGRLSVCLASVNFHPVYAGPAVRFRRYIAGFKARDLDIRVFTGTPTISKAIASGMEIDWRGCRPGSLLEQQALDGVPLQRVVLPDSHGRRRDLRFSRELVRFCSNSGTRPKAIQLLDLSIASIPALLRLRMLGIRTVFTATMLPAWSDRLWKRALLKLYLSSPMQFVDRVVVSSEVMRAQLRRIGVRPPIRVIPNGVDTQRFRPSENPEERLKVRHELGIGPDERVILFAGPVVARKGVDLILEAWARLGPKHPDLHMVVAGPRLDMNNPRNREFHTKVKTLVAASGAAKRIHFPGLVENIDDYMRSADLFLFTSRREGMPNVFLEAMASGLPILTTPFIGLPREFGEPDKQYLLVDYDPDSIAARVEHVFSNNSLAEILSRAALGWARNHLSVERSIDQYVDLYRQLAAAQ